MRLLLTLLSLASALGANLIENSSFEAGDLHGWSFGGATDPVRSPLWFTNAAARTGTKGVRLEYTGLVNNPAQIVSRGYRLKPNTQYTLTCYAKADAGNTAANHFYLYPVNLADDSLGHQGQAKGNYRGAGYALTTSWARYTNTFTTTTNLQALSYAVHIHSHWGVQSGTHYTNEWFNVDDVQLEESGSPSAYGPMNDVEVGGNVVRGKPGHLFYDTDTLSLDFSSFNNTAGSLSRTVAYEVRDTWNTRQTNGTFSVSPGAGASVTNQLTLTGMPYGYLRLTYWITNQEGSRGEIQFSKMFQPVSLSHRTNSFFGAHFLHSAWHLGAAQRAGFHWNRLFSVEEPGNPHDVSTTEGALTLYTNGVAMNRTYDIEPFMMLGADSLMARGALSAPEIPDWMTNSVNYWPATNKLYTWTTQVVHTYKPYVTYWGAGWNEIVEPHQSEANKIQELITWSSRAVRAADPTAIVVAADDYYAASMDTVLDAIGSSTIDIWSTHLYNYGQAGDESVYNYQRTNITGHVSRAWQTEAGLRTESPSRVQFWEELFPEGASAFPDGNGYLRDARMRAQQMAHMFWYSARDPFKVWFYYDARTSAGYDNIVHYSIFDHDMTFRPTGLMLSAAAQRMENATMKGRFSIDAKVDAYWWVRSGLAGVVMWPTNNDEVPTILGGDGGGGSGSANKLKLVSTLATNEFMLRDMYGNIQQYPTGGFPFGFDPIYIEAVGSTTTNGLLSSLSISTITDTNAPKLQIITWPLATYSGAWNFRWNAVDDISVDIRWNGPKTNASYAYTVNTNAIRYRTRLAPAESSYGHWTNTSWRYTNSMTWDENATFYVQAIDASGNTATASVSLFTSEPQGEDGSAVSAQTQGRNKLKGRVRIK